MEIESFESQPSRIEPMFGPGGMQDGREVLPFGVNRAEPAAREFSGSVTAEV